ncbi:MAG: calcium/sodium antiporter, partial [Paramuribaculum sp.]|nr:calcium/sodium antiporter [Paramuribaculum sp.]
MILNILLLIGGLALILVGANMLTDGSSDLARRMGISELVVGLTVVAFGTSTPELVISLISAVKGTSELAIGNVVGSNIFNICGIIGIVALIKPMKVSHDIMNNEIPLVFLSSLILLIMGNGPLLDSEPAMILSRVDGLLLILFFILFMRHTLSQAKTGAPAQESADPKPPMKVAKAILFVLLGLAGLIFGGDIFVDGATGIAKALGVSDAVIALTIVAVGTSLPELAVSITAAVKGKPELALGNVIGSNIFNIFLVLGASATIFPLRFGAIGNVDLLTLLLASALFWILGKLLTNNTKNPKSGG